MSNARFLHELHAAGETEQTLRSAIAAHGADFHKSLGSATDARRWLHKRDALMIELYLITGRIIDDLPQR